MSAARKLLLIDDDEDDRGFFLDVLGSIDPGIACAVARNGVEGLDKLVKEKYRPDAIFLDLNMPIMDGREFLRERMKHKNLEHIPITILTTSSDKYSISETKSLGAFEFITKPDTM